MEIPNKSHGFCGCLTVGGELTSFAPKKKVEKNRALFWTQKDVFLGLETSGIISLAGIIRYNHPKIGKSSVNDGFSIAMFACRVAMDDGDDL